jgi:hypothetical protein
VLAGCALRPGSPGREVPTPGSSSD